MKVLSNHSKGTLTFRIDNDANTNINEIGSKQLSTSSVDGNTSSNSNSSDTRSAVTEKYAVNKGYFLFIVYLKLYCLSILP